MLNSGNFVASRPVVLADFRLDDNLWIELARDNEIRRLIKSFDLFRPFSFSKTDPSFGQLFLYCGLKYIAN